MTYGSFIPINEDPASQITTDTAMRPSVVYALHTAALLGLAIANSPDSDIPWIGIANLSRSTVSAFLAGQPSDQTAYMGMLNCCNASVANIAGWRVYRQSADFGMIMDVANRYVDATDYPMNDLEETNRCYSCELPVN